MTTTISTTDKPEDKREKLRKLREFHQPTFVENGVPDATFIPKMAYRPYGKTELHIGFFLSEISKGDDIYIEFTSKELVPEDPDRKLYRWRFNPHFEDEYAKTDPTPGTGHVRYLVPVDELQVVKINKPEEAVAQSKINFDLPDPETDLPMDQMTIRDYAAIHMRKPVSRKEWLNELINKS